MSTGNQEYIRDMNRALVLEAIANHPPLSRADLAKMLHLTKATVSTIVQELLDRQLVIELGSAEKTSMGRKPILLTFNNRCGSIIAVDLGVKKITILTGDLKGKSCTVKEYPIDPSLSLEEYLISLLHKTKSDLPKTPCGLVGISIGIYGVVCDDLVLFTPYYDLKHSNLKNYLEEEFQVPVIVENEANLSVIGEAACAEHFKNMIFLNIHEASAWESSLTANSTPARTLRRRIRPHHPLPRWPALPLRQPRLPRTVHLRSRRPERFCRRRRLRKRLRRTLHPVLPGRQPQRPQSNAGFHPLHRNQPEHGSPHLQPGRHRHQQLLHQLHPSLIDEITSGIQNRLRWYLHVLPAHLQDVSVLMGGISLCSRNFLGISTFKLLDL